MSSLHLLNSDPWCLQWCDTLLCARATRIIHSKLSQLAKSDPLVEIKPLEDDTQTALRVVLGHLEDGTEVEASVSVSEYFSGNRILALGHGSNMLFPCAAEMVLLHNGRAVEYPHYGESFDNPAMKFYDYERSVISDTCVNEIWIEICRIKHAMH